MLVLKNRFLFGLNLYDFIAVLDFDDFNIDAQNVIKKIETKKYFSHQFSKNRFFYQIKCQ